MLPVFMLVLLALVEVAALVFTMSTLEHAVQDGGRLAALPGTSTETQVRDRVVQSATGIQISASAVTVTVNGGAKTFGLRASGDRVQVSATFAYRPLTATIFGAGLTVGLSSATEYAVE